MKKCPFFKHIQKCCFSCRVKYWPLSLSRQSKDLLHFWTCSGDGRLKTGELWQSPPMAVSVFLRRRNWNFFFMFLALKNKKKRTLEFKIMKFWKFWTKNCESLKKSIEKKHQNIPFVKAHFYEWHYTMHISKLINEKMTNSSTDHYIYK